MAALIQILSHIYTITTVFLTVLLLELLLSLRTLFKLISFPAVRASPTQFFQLVEEKIPTTLFKIKSLSHQCTDCAVCLCKFEDGDKIRHLKCDHTYHKDCLDQWLEQELATCPLCRREVLPEEVVARFRQPEVTQEYDGSDEELIFFLSALQRSSFHRLL